MNNKKRIELPLLIIFAVLSVFCLCTPAFAVVPETLQQSVTYNGETITLDMVKHSVRGPNYEVLVQDATGVYNAYTAPEVRTYVGRALEYPDSWVAGVLLPSGDFKAKVYFDRGFTWFTLNENVTGTKGDSTSDYEQWPSLDVTPSGYAGTDTYRFDIAVDYAYEVFSTDGQSNIDFSLCMIDYSLLQVKTVYLMDTLTCLDAARIVIRTSQTHCPYWGVSDGDQLGAGRNNWLADHVDADRDAVCVVADIGGGLAWVNTIDGTWAYSVNNSDPDAAFDGIFRHELGHTWSLSDFHANKCEGKTIMCGNQLHRFSGAAAYSVMQKRNEKISSFENLGVYTAVSLPPYASLDLVTGIVVSQQQGQQIVIDVMANDHDVNGDAISIQSFDASSVIGASIDLSVGTGPGGRDELIYTVPGVTGMDVFSYTIVDASGKTQTGKVYLDLVADYTIYEAEDATYSGCNFSSVNSGYTGTGYLWFGQNQSYIEWTVNVSTAGEYLLDFRHLSDPNTLELKVNGQVVNSAFVIPSSPDTWNYTDSEMVSLNAGSNTVRLTMDSYMEYIRVDHLRVTELPNAPECRADAYIQSGQYSDTNYGTQNELFIKSTTSADYNRDAYLKFDYNNKSTPLQSAVLRLTPKLIEGTPSEMTLRLRLLDDADDDWSETGITWNNRPAGTGSEVYVNCADLTVGQPLDIDVLSLIDQAQNTNKIASFHIDLISDPNLSYYLKFDSREASAGNVPLLLLQESHEAEDAVASNCSFSTSTDGYTGTGYMVVTAAGSYLEWTVTSPLAEMFNLSFHHRTESANSMTLTVNGQVVDSNYTLAGTGSAWAMSNDINVSLNPGSNTVRLTRNSGPNYVRLDHLLVETPTVDTDPPTPDPATFAVAPAADSHTAISMTATTGIDASGPVEHLFTETSGNPGGTSSAWQTTPSYTDSGLTPETQYTYTVTTRDSLGNIGTASAPASATTDPAPDTTPPTPNPATFAVAPAADSESAISMTATTGTDISGPVEYLFTETSGNPGGTSSGWQTSPSYTDSGLTASTQYTYTVTMRDSLSNTGTASAPASATTDSVQASMYVQAIDLSVIVAGGDNRKGVATVTIYDNLGQPLSGATVYGTFTGSYNESGSAVTDTNGQVTITTLSKVKNPSFTFTVDNVTASGYTYDSASNVETSDVY